MTITSVRIYPGDGCHVIAYASVRLERDWVIDSIRVVESPEGKPIISMPQIKTTRGDHREVVYPLSESARIEIRETILEEVRKGRWSRYKREGVVEG